MQSTPLYHSPKSSSGRVSLYGCLQHPGGTSKTLRLALSAPASLPLCERAGVRLGSWERVTIPNGTYRISLMRDETRSPTGLLPMQEPEGEPAAHSRTP